MSETTVRTHLVSLKVTVAVTTEYDNLAPAADINEHAVALAEELVTTALPTAQVDAVSSIEI